MQEIVNEIVKSFASQKIKVDGENLIKKGGHSYTSNDFFRKFNSKVAGLSKVNSEQFENWVKDSFKAKQESSIYTEAVTQDYTEFIKGCEFILRRFKWFITREMDRVFFLKTLDDAEEYKKLTTEINSDKFYNGLKREDKEKLKKLIKAHNLVNSDKIIQNSRKAMSILISHLDENSDGTYELEKEPISLTNNRAVAAFKFFDMKRIKENGDHYVETYGVSPPMPCWDEFFLRIRNQYMVPVVKAFLTGIFMAKNKAKQALYIWGEGDDGKSQITEALTLKIGEDVTAVLDQYMRSNQFSSYDFYGMRFCLGEELSAPNVIQNKTFHAITGRSRVRIEAKGEQAFHTRLYCCSVITSNLKPEIADVKNQKSRLLFIEVDPPSESKINTEGASWAKGIQEEMDNMIYNGLKYFNEYNPDGSSYRMPKEYAEDLNSLHSIETQRVSEFIDNCFEEDKNSYIRSKLGDAFVAYLAINHYEKGQVPSEYRTSQIASTIIERLNSKFPGINIKGQKDFPSSSTRQRCIIGLRVKISANALNTILETCKL